MNFESKISTQEIVPRNLKAKFLALLVSISALIPAPTSAQESGAEFSDQAQSVESFRGRDQKAIIEAYKIFEDYIKETGDSTVHLQVGSLLGVDFSHHSDGYKLSLTEKEQGSRDDEPFAYDLYDVDKDGFIDAVESRRLEGGESVTESVVMLEGDMVQTNHTYSHTMNLLEQKMKEVLKRADK